MPEEDNALMLDRLMRARRSCRGFRPEPVPRDLIEEMLKTAQQAASWCNAQPWQIIVTEGEATKRFRDALYTHAASLGWSDPRARPEQPDFPFPARYEGVYKARQRATGWALYESVGVSFGDRAASGRQALENFRLFGAPHVAIVTTEADLGVYGAIDCGGWLTAFMLAAQSRGVATIAQAALAGVAPFVRAWFSIPEGRRIVVAVSFGYEDAAHPANAFRTDRAALEEIVRFVG